MCAAWPPHQTCACHNATEVTRCDAISDWTYIGTTGYAHLPQAGHGEGRRLRVPNTAEAAADALEQLGPEDAVALEVSSGAFRFYEILADRAKQAVVVDARIMQRLGSRKRKSDWDDAKLLVEPLALETLPGLWVPPAAILELRALVNLNTKGAGQPLAEP